MGRHGEGSKGGMLWPERAIKDCELGDAKVPWTWAGGCPSDGVLLGEYGGSKGI